MIVAFDLDDTLYPERTYVASGFRAAAAALEERFDVDRRASYALMMASLERCGRGNQFDEVLKEWGLHSRANVHWLVGVYRSHEPAIRLPRESWLILDFLAHAGHRLYLVTDGHARVQAKKIEALGIGGRFVHCYLTNRYGRSSAKPSTRVFTLMLARERVGPESLVYVGDDPSKDFVGVRTLGGRTVRVLTGGHRSDLAAGGHDADVRIGTLTELPRVLAAWV